MNEICNLNEIHNLNKTDNLRHRPQLKSKLARSFFVYLFVCLFVCCNSHTLKFATSFRQFSSPFHQEVRMKIQLLSHSFINVT
jgi:hypothetical protein